MAAVVEQHWQAPLSGLAVTRYGHAVPCRQIEVIEAGHPYPDSQGEVAAARALALARELTADDLLLCLISGGGSALLALPAPGLALGDKQQLTRALLTSGAPISAINCVRKHLSAIKGGRLALAAQPATVVSLIISDVPGDDIGIIASGPTAADHSTRVEAAAILARYGIEVPAAVAQWLADPRSETPKADDAAFARVRNLLIATPGAALQAASARASAAGVTVTLLGAELEGEARQLAAWQARQALEFCAQQPGAGDRRARLLLSGGETTVAVRGAGRGGRNAEYLLALALALDGEPGIWALAADTDGIDGTEDNAGALIGPDTLARGRALGLDAAARLEANDTYGYFAALGDLLVTGPTRTNVNDFRAIYIA